MNFRSGWIGFFAGLVAGIVLSGVGFAVLLAWSINNQRASAQDRALAERCESREKSREQVAQLLGGPGKKFTLLNESELKPKLMQVKVGMAIQDVEGILGHPTFAEGLFTKEGAEFQGCYWNYVINGEIGENGYLLEDTFYTVLFDRHDRVVFAPLTEVPGP